jgi:CDP-diacylglycerol--serine O-phosphatidyltransferase
VENSARAARSGAEVWVLFAVFVCYGVSGYVVYAYRRAKGSRVSMIATSTDEPEEAGLHR